MNIEKLLLSLCFYDSQSLFACNFKSPAFLANKCTCKNCLCDRSKLAKELLNTPKYKIKHIIYKLKKYLTK